MKLYDNVALENVVHRGGGPFAAALYTFNSETGTLEKIGDTAVNAVLATGIPTAHAEDQALSLQNLRALRDALGKMRSGAREVILFSSAQCCPACHSKLELTAQNLIAEGLLAKGQFTIYYGADYEQTRDVAEFNDGFYLEDMQMPPEARVLKQSFLDFSKAPSCVREPIKNSSCGSAVVVDSEGHRLGYGYDNRVSDPFETPEVSAIRHACTIQKLTETERPWDLGGATLYTWTRDIGPMAYTLAQWAHVTRLVTLESPSIPDHWRTRESQMLTNAAFFNLIAAQDSNAPEACVTLVHLPEGFKNLAQQAWKEKIAQERTLHGENTPSLYNGTQG